ncbi:MAG: hypothetical protein J5929_10155 [Eubacterium sp.]|nr:hypothetical protein [Eubacterium sp.]
MNNVWYYFGDNGYMK